jgi:hypothetical protein
MTKNIPANITSTDDVVLTVESLKGVMPKRQKHNINQHLVDELNKLVVDPEAREGFRENLLGYTSVLSDPNVKLNDYVQAVKYVSYKLLGYTNQESWMKTFPVRYQRLIDLGKTDGFIRSTVACYNRGKLVNTILEQTMVPSYVLNQDLYQKALNVQLGLMTSAESEKVRTEAANSLLVHLKQPETTKLTLDVNVTQDDSIKELRDATVALADVQRKAIEQGLNTAAEVAKSKLIPAEYEVIAVEHDK